MNLISTYSAKIKDYNKIFNKTVKIYRNAVDFYIDVILKEWDTFKNAGNLKDAVRFAEMFTVKTKGRLIVKYDFSTSFYKFPCYLRRSAIAEAFGKACSYKSNLDNWITSKSTKKKPSITKAGYVYPCLYRENMYCETKDPYVVEIKVFIHNTWDWLKIELKKSDVDYIRRHCFPFTTMVKTSGVLKSRSVCAPTLMKRGKEWFLDYPIKEKVEFINTCVNEQTVIAVDLGINNACTLSVLHSDGTVVGREFLSLPTEKDSLNHAIGRIKKAQKHGSCKTPRLWARAKGINDHLSVLTAQFIIDKAVLYDADVIVFEHLDRNGKIKGSNKQKIHMWRSQYVQQLVTHKAHKLGIRISHVCAWNTSKLAYDGSGRVLRGTDAGLDSYSVCKFSSGKIYNCDLSASYNIGARYFVREILKSLSATTRLLLEANVPEVSKRSTCTLSTLISLNAVLSVL